MPKQPHKHPLLPNYTFSLSILLLCLLPPLIFTSPAPANPQTALIPPTPILREGDRRTFHLKHIYHRGSSSGPFSSLFRRLDFTPSQLATQHRLSPHEETSYAIGMQFGSTFKPPVGYTQDMRRARTNGEMSSLCRTMGAYEEGYGLVPDTTDNETIVGLAKMCYNAYNDANKRDDWYDLGEKWGVNVSFGWETNGLRGHIFGDDENTTLILAIKGTSAGIFGGGDTGSNDKLNVSFDEMPWLLCRQYYRFCWRGSGDWISPSLGFCRPLLLVNFSRTYPTISPTRPHRTTSSGRAAARASTGLGSPSAVVIWATTTSATGPA
ncbi:hypothetical protein BC936DRAFT_141156 [Jimgerdemannia flammicorona]|uniref:triacylglycerol lipase n=1 Tax=Jimgerdemannia flammicorona TaxID=994334 RepID=A0A433A2V7_9FUNG|nr:hypothetical protein BC936DRAFT_141156 [Jimgerdemannia flammicorona]